MPVKAKPSNVVQSFSDVMFVHCFIFLQMALEMSFGMHKFH